MGKPQRDGMVCMCLECCMDEEVCPPTIACPDSAEVMEQRRRQGEALREEEQRQDMLDNIMAQARLENSSFRGEKQ